VQNFSADYTSKLIGDGCLWLFVEGSRLPFTWWVYELSWSLVTDKKRGRTQFYLFIYLFSADSDKDIHRPIQCKIKTTQCQSRIERLREEH